MPGDGGFQEELEPEINPNLPASGPDPLAKECAKPLKVLSFQSNGQALPAQSCSCNMLPRADIYMLATHLLQILIAEQKPKKGNAKGKEKKGSEALGDPI